MSQLFKNKFNGVKVDLYKVGGGRASFFPQGGGFLASVDESTFFSDFEPILAPEPFAKIRFGGDWDDNVYDGYSDRRWNGWANPWVTREVAEQIIKNQESLNFGAFSEDVYGFRWSHDTLLVRYPEDGEEYPETPKVINTVDGELTLYNVSFGWCWNQYEG
jgi:hypothetical protein